MRIEDDVNSIVASANAPALEAELPASLTDRVLMKVRLRRISDDDKEGVLRDYPDGTAGRRFHGPGLEVEKDNLEFAQRALQEAMRAASPSWRLLLELAAARVYVESDETKLAAQLVALSAVAVAWAEGISMRADRRRIDAEASASRRGLRVVTLDGGGKMVIADHRQPEHRSWWQRVLASLKRSK